MASSRYERPTQCRVAIQRDRTHVHYRRRTAGYIGDLPHGTWRQPERPVTCNHAISISLKSIVTPNASTARIHSDNRSITLEDTHSLTHSLTRPLDRVVAASRHHDHSSCPSQHLRWARRRPPVARLIHVSRGRPRGRFQSGLLSRRSPALQCWQPDEVLHAQEPILADDVCVQTSWYVCRRFCCRCIAVMGGATIESGGGTQISPTFWNSLKANTLMQQG